MGFGDGIGGNRPNLELLLQRPAALGKVFFVDSGGSNGNEGTDPAHPLDAITDAMDKCTASKGDVIVVMGLSPSTSEATETWPIAMDVAGVLLTGLYSRGSLSDSGFGTDEADVDTITVTANYVTIENLYLGVATGGTLASVIEGGASAFAFTLRNCWIEFQYTALYGFYTGASYDFPNLLIEDCRFGNPQTTYMTSAIKLANSSRGIIRRNVFNNCLSYAIDLGAGCLSVAIHDNRFKMSADTKGFAIYVASGSANNYIDGNRAAHGYNDPTANPYLDMNGAGSGNLWGLNYKGGTATAPATS